MNIKEIKIHASSRDAEQGYKGIKYTVYEWLSTLLVKILMYTPITANHITIVGIIFVFIAAFFLGFGTFSFGLIGIVFLYLGELMDAVDGSLARCKKSCSRLQSNFLGNIYHSSSYPVLFLGISVGAYFQTGNLIYIIFGGLTALFQEMIGTMLFLKNTVLYKTGEGKYLEKDEENIFRHDKNSIRKVLLEIFKAPFKHIRLMIILSVIFGRLDLFTIFYAIFTPIKLFGFIYSIYAMFKKIEGK
jgi:phosphatidylglycerophosphate synthase